MQTGAGAVTTPGRGDRKCKCAECRSLLAGDFMDAHHGEIACKQAYLLQQAQTKGPIWATDRLILARAE